MLAVRRVTHVPKMVIVGVVLELCTVDHALILHGSRKNVAPSAKIVRTRLST